MRDQPCVDMQEMNPYFLVTTLVGRFDSKSFMRNFERTMQPNLPLTLGTNQLDKTALRNWQFVLANTSSIVLSRFCSLPDRRRHAEPLKSPCQPVLDALLYGLQITSFSRFRVSWHIGCLLSVEEHHGEEGVTIARNPLEGGTRDESLRDPTELAFFHDLLLPISGVIIDLHQ